MATTRTKYVARPPQHLAERISRVLIANRGEIAERVVRTCEVLGIESVTLYTEQDRKSSFWRVSTDSHYAGDISVLGNVYLDARRLIDIAKKCGVDAIHPGYGYLSENAEFARLVVAAGLIWIGPDSEVISLLGDKAQCKQFLQTNLRGDVPLIPGSVSRSQELSVLLDEAKRVGYPVLLKASAGGGGKGMRVVDDPTAFESSLNTAKSEAKRSFGSDNMLLEKYISHGKHIEVQVFGDNHGNCIIFGDRECSVQRRHQKVIEEAPAVVSAALKKVMENAARAIVTSTKYSGAGTVEFIVDMQTQAAYFLEVNTRIQVEHPITEEIFAIDLVALQFFVACGGNINSVPNRYCSGHAVELRLYAEDPYSGFLPQRGDITLFQESKIPARYESSIKTKDEVSTHFDPMIAKIIVHAEDRQAAIKSARRVIESTVCLGLQTNKDFLAKCLECKSFIDSSYTTSFIQDNIDQLLQREQDHITGSLITSILYRALRHAPSEPSRLTPPSTELISTPAQTQICIRKVSTRSSTRNRYTLESWTLQNDSTGDQNHSKAMNQEGAPLVSNYYRAMNQTITQSVTVDLSDMRIRDEVAYQIVSAWVTINDARYKVIATVHDRRDGTCLMHIDRFGSYERHSPRVGFSHANTKRSSGASDQTDAYRAPMPGRVVRVDVVSGGAVKEGQGLLVIESMKTEVRILAKSAGNAEILVKEGDAIAQGSMLAKIHAAE